MAKKRQTKEVTKRNKAEWRPNPNQWAYFVALEEALQTRAPAHDSVIAPKCGIARQTIAGWREIPEFNAWLEERFALRSGVKQQIAARFRADALKGSVPHAEWLAKVFAWFAQKDPEAVGQGGSTTVIIAPPGSDEKFVSEQKASIVVRV